MGGKDFIVVAYDIRDDTVRTRICNSLKNYGNHVQLSVFECVLDGKAYERLKRELREMIDEKEDLVRLYKLCTKCVARSELLGEGSFSSDTDLFMV
jgi:CRISPR-associated protein Cas2